jgi:prepilin-type N-terminal cleavage/methylation domain-containing protein
MRRLTQERGFTIVEMMVAASVLLIGALGTLAMLDTANKRSRSANDRQNATAVTRQVVEAAKSVPFRDIAPGSIVTTLRQDTSIAGVSASPWRIERDNTAYTVQVDVCWLDERADGLGSRAAGNFCPGSGTGGTADGNSIDHKRVTVTASWDTDAGKGSVRQSTLVSARGGIDAPGVTSVQLTSPASSPITSAAATSASFAVATSVDAAASGQLMAPSRTPRPGRTRRGPSRGSSRRATASMTSPPRRSTPPASAARCARRPSS